MIEITQEEIRTHEAGAAWLKMVTTVQQWRREVESCDWIRSKWNDTQNQWVTLITESVAPLSEQPQIVQPQVVQQ